MNSDTKGNKGQDDKDFQNAEKDNKGQQKASFPSAHPTTENAEPDFTDDLSLEKTGNPYDSENLDKESGSESKDITEQDTQEDLIENDPSEGFATDIDTDGSDEAESDTFETIQPDPDNPVNKEFEIGQLANDEFKEDERAKDETGNSAVHNYKPSPKKILIQ